MGNFILDWENEKIFRIIETYLNERKKGVIWICGASGSGKSTLMKDLSFEIDDIAIIDMEKFRKLLFYRIYNEDYTREAVWDFFYGNMQAIVIDAIPNRYVSDEILELKLAGKDLLKSILQQKSKGEYFLSDAEIDLILGKCSTLNTALSALYFIKHFKRMLAAGVIGDVSAGKGYALYDLIRD